MARRRLLMSWIGHADLWAMAADSGDAGKRVLDIAGLAPRAGEPDGPVKTAIMRGDFDVIHLLSDYPAGVDKPFAKWLGCKAVCHQARLAGGPSDYRSVFEETDRILAELRDAGELTGADLNILLSPGTPAMTAVWVLLGKSRYPATFFQTHKGKLSKAEIPFDLTVDYVPELLRDADLALRHLTANNPQDVEGFKDIVGDSPALRLAVGRAQRAALRDVPVLILGESGSGKEMFAQAIHQASPRRGKPFVPVNCAAIPPDLFESELFGHVKGAFTGANADRKGRFTEADGGTLFLDELGECSLQAQTKLLRVLQPPANRKPGHCEFTPVGADKPKTADVRIIAATNADLAACVRAGKFREDLYYRLAVIPVRLPPLRERRADVPILAKAYLAKINAEFADVAASGKPAQGNKSFSDAAMEFVKKHDWPGNVRQLHAVILRAMVMAAGDRLERHDFVEALADSPGKAPVDVMEIPLGDDFSLEKHLDDIQRHYLERAMAQADGVKRRAAELLGLAHYQTLDAQLKRLKVRGWS